MSKMWKEILAKESNFIRLIKTKREYQIIGTLFFYSYMVTFLGLVMLSVTNLTTLPFLITAVENLADGYDVFSFKTPLSSITIPEVDVIIIPPNLCKQLT